MDFISISKKQSLILQREGLMLNHVKEHVEIAL